MKKQIAKIVLILLPLWLMVSCSSSDSSTPVNLGTTVPPTQTQTVVKPKVIFDYSEKLDYSYDANKSNIQELLPLYVNRYQEFDEKLQKFSDENNRTTFDNYYEWFVGDLITTLRAVDSHPSYAPRGESKSFIASVVDKTIDYSDYKLIGDFDDNGEVNFEDEKLLKEVIYLQSDDPKYDINVDNKVDILDMINLVARFTTEIKTFDFYTLGGEKLDIESRTFSDARSFNYETTQTKIMVVAKDSNNVSGFESGLDDIDTLWYKNISRSEQRAILRAEGLDATDPKKLEFVNEALEFILEEPEPYLLGWKVSLKFNSSDKFYEDLDDQGLIYMDTTHFLPLKKEISSHFKTTTMGVDTMSYLSKSTFLYHIGAGRYIPKDEEINGNYVYDLDDNSFVTHVKAIRKSFKHSHTVGGKTVFIQTICHASSVLVTSNTDKTLSGFIKKDGNLIEDDGVLTATRVGPDPKEVIYEVKLNHAEYKLENIPFGAYKLDYETKCGCTQTIEDKFIFKKNRAFIDQDFNIESKEVRVTLRILDADNEPVKGKSVKIHSDECLSEEQMFMSTSDSNGEAKFSQDIPIGSYRVYVDGIASGNVKICDNLSKDIVIDDKALWDINITFNGRFGVLQNNIPNVEIASISDANIVLVDPAAYPYPEELSFDGKRLVDTSYFKENGINFELNYYPEGISNTYSKGLSLVMLDEDTYGSIGGDGDTWFGDPASAPSWDGINTLFNVAQTQAFTNHKTFTLSDTGRWVNDGGSSTLTVVFTPVF